MNRRARLAGFILIAAGAAAGGFLAARHHAGRNAAAVPAPLAAQAQMIGRIRPDFTLADVTGMEHRVNEWDGRVLVLNFWATWCPPCRREIPEFVTLQDKLGGRGLQFVGIALQRPEEVGDFIREYGINYPVLAGEMSVVQIAQSYGNAVGALPYTVIVDRSGHIAFVRTGPLPGKQAESAILPLL